MAEIAGVVIGAVGLATLFDSCMSAFQYIESGANCGIAYKQTALRIEIQRVRLSRWAKKVEFVDNHDGRQFPTNIQVADPTEVAQVLGLLEVINDCFKIAEKSSKIYKQQTAAPDSTSPDVSNFDTLIKRMRKLGSHHQKEPSSEPSLGKKATWALHHESKFAGLLGNLKENITDLISLFPAIVPEQQALAISEADELIQPSEIEEPIVATLYEATKDQIDEMLQQAIDQKVKAVTGHTFGGEIINEGKGFFGDYVAPGSERDNKSGNSYGKITNSANAVGHYGNKFGGLDPFA